MSIAINLMLEQLGDRAKQVDPVTQAVNALTATVAGAVGAITTAITAALTGRATTTGGPATTTFSPATVAPATAASPGAAATATGPIASPSLASAPAPSQITGTDAQAIGSFSPLVPALDKLTVVITAETAAVQRLTEALGKSGAGQQSAGSLTKAAGVAGEAVGAEAAAGGAAAGGEAAAGGAAAGGTSILAGLAGAAGMAVGALTSLAEVTGAAGRGMAAAVSTLSQVVTGDLGGAVSGAAHAAAGALSALGPIGAAAGAAVAGLGDALSALWSVAVKGVELFNPAVMLQFNQVVRDLTATVGMALQPIIESATVGLQHFGEMLLPVMERLEPVFARLGDAFLQVIEGPLNIVMQSLENLGPILDALAAAWEASAEILKPVYAVLELIGDLIGGAVKSAMEMLSELFTAAAAALRPLTEALTAAVQWLRAFLGLPTNPRETKSIGGMASPQNTAFTSFSDFGRKVALESAKAFGGAQASRSDREVLEGIEAEMKKLNNGESRLPEAIAKHSRPQKSTYGADSPRSGPRSPRRDVMAETTGGGSW